MNETRMMICEGKCNPQVQWLDAMIYDLRKQESTKYLMQGGVQPVGDNYVRELRKLKHTVHTRSTFNTELHWCCADCGVFRK